MPNKTVIPLNQSQLYKLTSPRRLADVLGLAEAELRAMATGPDRYRQFEIEKKSGGKRPVEDPVAPLKRVQGRIAKMLARIEPPSFLFCPVKGRCYVSNAARHRGNRVVHCLDIKKFFPNTPRVRVIAFFQSIMGCRADVAGLLGDLCTFEGHLPTGSPLSPILAYYSYHDMWAEIAAFCTAKGYTLTVYVDDVTISGAKVPVADVWHVRRMIHRTGLRYHKLKHYVDRPAEITGVVVRDGKVVVPNRQRLKHRQTRLALQQPGSGDQRLKGRLSGLAGQMRQIDSMNEPG
ncbi:reverse transcriptase family protein [Sphingomonas sp. 3F27F9]|jgi:hypothetical protein|uniref:reverse transcriptase family protein n=1 Tax=Sphingomonas sp. 3F27F9 TaxID=2502209 RepID=UPI00036D9442|nr:reverse transcriptase family protein [Sphingomonas sp. 3F27F9]